MCSRNDTETNESLKDLSMLTTSLICSKISYGHETPNTGCIDNVLWQSVARPVTRSFAAHQRIYHKPI